MLRVDLMLLVVQKTSVGKMKVGVMLHTDLLDVQTAKELGNF